MNKQEKMYLEIQHHGEQLNAIFNTGIEPVKLCKKLRRLEIQAHRQATDYCNGVIQTEHWESISNAMLNKVDKILHYKEKDIPVFFNADARGYALKIDSDYVLACEPNLYRDMGGYGLIAPDLSNLED